MKTLSDAGADLPTVCGKGLGHQFSRMPALMMTSRHFATSARMRAPNAAAELACGSTPCLANAALGARIRADVAKWRDVITSAGIHEN